jgi:hypothetical protein
VPHTNIYLSVPIHPFLSLYSPVFFFCRCFQIFTCSYIDSSSPSPSPSPSFFHLTCILSSSVIRFSCNSFLGFHPYSRSYARAPSYYTFHLYMISSDFHDHGTHFLVVVEECMRDLVKLLFFAKKNSRWNCDFVIRTRCRWGKCG